MANWFVFNGDADGLCAAHQLRLSGIEPAHLLTGVKRDIGLLARCPARAGDQVWVADISLDSNRAALDALLRQDIQVSWFDHHFAGAIPAHPQLQAYIDTSAAVCSSLLVDHHVQGRYRPWAVTAAFGDNLIESAHTAARDTDLSLAEIEALAELGTLLNYNAYGETVADLHVDPAQLFMRLAPFDDPRAFLAHDRFAAELRAAMHDDLTAARGAPLLHADAASAVISLPNAAWARRAHGVFANDLARSAPRRAHAILVESGEGYAVSVRAPAHKPTGADTLCRQFATGGGRSGAAGINVLPGPDLERFLAAFRVSYANAPA